jgi:hypothetical protein
MTTFLTTGKRFGAVLSVALIAILLALAPFASALEIHHALAEADHDGHQHSDFDLCQWVQLHSATSCEVGLPDDSSLAPPKEHDPPIHTVVCSQLLASAASSRAPPQS